MLRGSLLALFHRILPSSKAKPQTTHPSQSQRRSGRACTNSASDIVKSWQFPCGSLRLRKRFRSSLNHIMTDGLHGQGWPRYRARRPCQNYKMRQRPRRCILHRRTWLRSSSGKLSKLFRSVQAAWLLSVLPTVSSTCLSSSLSQPSKSSKPGKLNRSRQPKLSCDRSVKLPISA